jgi:hypothetical protein
MWPSVQRSDLNSIFTCQAINTELVEPRESSYVLDLHRKSKFYCVINNFLKASKNVEKIKTTVVKEKKTRLDQYDVTQDMIN